MTRYQCPVTDVFLAGGFLVTGEGGMPVVSGLKFISRDGPWPGHPGVSLCTFDDDDAPAEMEGKIVEPQFTRFGPTTEITGRTVLGES